MGVKRTVVGTSVSRVIPDSHLPHSAQTGIAKSLLSGDEEGDLIDYIENELTNSLGIRADRMYEYAGRGKYLYGLPSGGYDQGAKVPLDLHDVLVGIEHDSVHVNYSQYGPPNDLHIGWMHLVKEQGYLPGVNELTVLSAAKGTTVYLDDMVIVVPASQASTVNPATLDQWGDVARAGVTPERNTMTAAARKLLKPTPVQLDPAATTEHLLVKYVWQTAAGLQRDSFTIPIGDLDPNSNYFHARYVVGGLVIKYWMYKAGSGKYPVLDALTHPGPVDSGSFFPFTYFRFDHVSEIADKTSASYLSNKKLVKYLGIDYDTIAAGIDASPDIDLVEQAMMLFAVPANTEDELERRYLYEFFDALYQSPAYGPDHFDNAPDDAFNHVQQPKQPVFMSVVIQDSRFKMTLEFQAIYKRRVAGVLGAIGKHDSGYTIANTTLDAIDPTSGGHSSIYISGEYHYFRRQISTGFYDEIVVPNLKTVFWILGSFKQAVGSGDAAILMIPLDRSITKLYPIPVRERLYARSLYYVFNSVEVQHLRWYQTEAFSLVLLVVAVVITIYSFGTQVNLIWAALAVGAYSAAAYLVLEILLEYLVAYLAFKTAVRVFGARIALIVAIVAAVVGMSGAIGAGGLAGAPWAADLLSLSTGLASAVKDKYQADMTNLVGEQKDFLKEEEKSTKLLDTAQELLNTSVHLDPFVIFGETPHDYYNRTVHSGNIGVIGIDAVSSYVDIALTLPKFSESVGGIGHDL